jgi:hypothetical protein
LILQPSGADRENETVFGIIGAMGIEKHKERWELVVSLVFPMKRSVSRSALIEKRVNPRDISIQLLNIALRNRDLELGIH